MLMSCLCKPTLQQQTNQMGSSSLCFLVVCCSRVLFTASSVGITAPFARFSWISLTRKMGWVTVDSCSVHRKLWLGRPDPQALLSLVPHTHSPSGVLVPPAVDWSALIGGFVRWLSGLAPPPPGAGVRSQQPVVPCAPSPPPLHTRAHAQGKTCARPLFLCHKTRPAARRSESIVNIWCLLYSNGALTLFRCYVAGQMSLLLKRVASSKP